MQSSPAFISTGQHGQASFDGRREPWSPLCHECVTDPCMDRTADFCCATALSTERQRAARQQR